MKWLSLQRTTFVENESQNTGGITEPNPDPIPDPEPDPETGVVSIDSNLTITSGSGDTLNVTLWLSRALPVDFIVHYNILGDVLVQDGAPERKQYLGFIRIRAIENLSFRTKSGGTGGLGVFTNPFLTYISHDPLTFVDGGVTYRIDLKIDNVPV